MLECGCGRPNMAAPEILSWGTLEAPAEPAPSLLLLIPVLSANPLGAVQAAGKTAD